MGKLIKNHWARLIILTAAACKQPPSYHHAVLHHSVTISIATLEMLIYFVRPNSCLPRRLLLAQALLGLPHQESRRCRQTFPHTPNHKPLPRLAGYRLGMAPQILRRYNVPQIDRDETGGISAELPGCDVAVSRDESGLVLSDWHGSVLLGF